MKKIALLCVAFYYLPLLQAQSIDSTFGNNGIVTADVGERNINLSTGRQTLLKSDGSMFVLFETKGKNNRSFTFITKLDINGKIDKSYGNNGYSDRVNATPSQAIFQKDGKIVVAGSTSGYYSDFVIIRYNINGSLDKTFGDNGVSAIDFNSGNDYARSIAIQEDGKIVLAGLDYRNGQQGDFLVARYNAYGNVDSSFSNIGYAIIDFSPGSEEASSVAIQKDGKIVVTGSAEDSNFHPFAAIARYNSDGTLDNTFDSDGKQTIISMDDEGNTSNFYGMSTAIQNDGKIVIGGTRLARLNKDGTIDMMFGENGIQTKVFGPFSQEAYSITIQTDGKILAAGTSKGDFAVARFNDNGSPDKSFSEDGVQITDFDGQDDWGNSITIQSDGKVLVTGSDIAPCPYDDCPSKFAIARYNSDGTIDETFDEDGKLTEGFSGGNTIYERTAIQKDGKIIVTGKTTNNNSDNSIMARYTSGGILDNTFGKDGIQNPGFNLVNVALQIDGKIIGVGAKGADNLNEFAIARYNTDGTSDVSFSDDGIQITNFGTSDSKATAVAIQSDGKIVVAGGASNHIAIARYNMDGSLDNTFSDDGWLTNDLLGPVSSLAVDRDNKVTVVTNSAIVRYNAEGGLDYTFGLNGIQVIDISAISAAIQNDGKIVVLGYTYDSSGDYIIKLIRYNSDGNVDVNFAAGGREIPFLNAFSLAILSDNKIAVGGYANGSNFTTYSALALYNIDGDLDGVEKIEQSDNILFNQISSSGERSYINSITIADNKLYTTGSLTYQGELDFLGNYGVIMRFLPYKVTPTFMTLTSPRNNATYLAPAAHIKLSAVVRNADGNISKVEFYKDNTLLHTETVAPYGYVWRDVPVGDYTLTAKATDNNGFVVTSEAVYISVVPNKPPIVSIVKPKNNQPFAARGYIHFEADAKDVDGRVTRVEFYNGSTLLNTQYQYPYTFVWQDVTVGTYTITAVAVDNWGAQTTSEPITIKVIPGNTTIVRDTPSSLNNKTNTDESVSIRLLPNPVTDILRIYTAGLQQNKPLSILVISSSGAVIKTIKANSSTKVMQLNVSSFVSGAYVIKLISADKVLYKQFVKM